MGTRAIVAMKRGNGWRGCLVWYDGGPEHVGAEVIAGLTVVNGDFAAFEKRYIEAGRGGWRAFPTEKLDPGTLKRNLYTHRTLAEADPHWLYLLDPNKRTLEAYRCATGGMKTFQVLEVQPSGLTEPRAIREWDALADEDVQGGWFDGWHDPDRHLRVRHGVRKVLSPSLREPLEALFLDAIRALTSADHVILTSVMYGGYGDPRELTLSDLRVRYPTVGVPRKDPYDFYLQVGRERLETDWSWRVFRPRLAAVIPDFDTVELALARAICPGDTVDRGAYGLRRRKVGEAMPKWWRFDETAEENGVFVLLDWLRGFQVPDTSEPPPVEEDEYAGLKDRFAAEWPEMLGELEAAVARLGSDDARVARDADTAIYRLTRRLERGRQ